MRIYFTKHAKLRIRERNISMVHIKQTIINPDNKQITFESRLLVRKKFGSKTLELVYAEYIDKIIVITLYYL